MVKGAFLLGVPNNLEPGNRDGQAELPVFADRIICDRLGQEISLWCTEQTQDVRDIRQQIVEARSIMETWRQRQVVLKQLGELLDILIGAENTEANAIRSTPTA